MEIDIIDLINNKIKDLCDYSFDSKMLKQRGVTDYIENLCCERITQITHTGITVSDVSSVKSVEDIEIKSGDNVYKIDIKSYAINREFLMPNLISIDRARKYLKTPSNHIIYIFIEFTVVDDIVRITNLMVKPIESLDWSYLSIQNLGKGQLQMKNITTLTFNDTITRKDWYDRLIKEGNEYYDKLILKVSEYKINWNDESKWD